MNLDKVRAVLRALKAKTVENGCTEDEAMAAAEKMAELLSRHGLSEDDLTEAEYCEVKIGIGRRSPLDNAWLAVSRFADCRGYYDRRDGKLMFCFFGRAQDVLVAEYVYEVLRAACDQALATFRHTDAYTRRRKPKTRNHAVKAFLEGLAVGLIKKLDAGLWRRYGAEVDGDRALALIKSNRDQIDAQLGRQGASLKSCRALATADGAFKDQARSQGYQAARTIDVNAGVAAGNKVTGVLA